MAERRTNLHVRKHSLSSISRRQPGCGSCGGRRNSRLALALLAIAAKVCRKPRLGGAFLHSGNCDSDNRTCKFGVVGTHSLSSVPHRIGRESPVLDPVRLCKVPSGASFQPVLLRAEIVHPAFVGNEERIAAPVTVNADRDTVIEIVTAIELVDRQKLKRVYHNVQTLVGAHWYPRAVV